MYIYICKYNISICIFTTLAMYKDITGSQGCYSFHLKFKKNPYIKNCEMLSETTRKYKTNLVSVWDILCQLDCTNSSKATSTVMT